MAVGVDFQRSMSSEQESWMSTALGPMIGVCTTQRGLGPVAPAVMALELCNRNKAFLRWSCVEDYDLEHQQAQSQPWRRGGEPCSSPTEQTQAMPATMHYVSLELWNTTRENLILWIEKKNTKVWCLSGLTRYFSDSHKSWLIKNLQFTFFVYFHLLVHSPNSHTSHNWGGPKPRASSGSSMWVQESKHLNHALLFSQKKQHGVGSETHEPGLDLAPIWDVDDTGSSFTHYDTCFHFFMEIFWHKQFRLLFKHQECMGAQRGGTSG